MCVSGTVKTERTNEEPCILQSYGRPMLADSFDFLLKIRLLCMKLFVSLVFTVLFITQIKERFPNRVRLDLREHHVVCDS